MAKRKSRYVGDLGKARCQAVVSVRGSPDGLDQQCRERAEPGSPYCLTHRPKQA